ncbi:YjhG/YagF family D-xylonate dehydratase [Pedosphaera parvula]|uniref:Dehydratase, YjhG/YagF family n=1 Tax=Pedosphaera parvula (strain Ellin514) TaxID=320771 RepID=B9XB68_PEDPL|nr:YjhG/YagF family D-xylonate dehydratase [Pedosphaera parvula]EEF62753.1 dehydratase, YjhG/YagF family [Pedosphaera parvula Ellin514]
MSASVEILESASPSIYQIQTKAKGPVGQLPLTEDLLLNRPSGDLFGLTQNAGMGWNPSELGRKQFLILSTQGGLRAPDGQPIALGYHTGHWEIGLLVKEAAEEFRRLKAIPFAAYCSDPCDGRTQGTTGMFDSLPYRNDAAIIFRRLARSLPQRAGVMGVATCDKGLPAMMMALAGMRDLPCILVPGGVTLPPETGEDAGTIQTIGARFAHGTISLEEAADLGCRACASPGGGCQFLGTAATSQVVGEALGMSLPHSALAPSGQPVWLDMATRSARALCELEAGRKTMAHILTDASIRNAMVVHAAFGGSTNLLLHIPAIAHAAGLRIPTVEDWIEVNRRVPRLVSVLPNGPVHHPTVRVFLAGGVPEVMLHLRRLGLLETKVLTVAGRTLDDVLNWWEKSERRQQFREILKGADGVEPDEVIMSPEMAKACGMTSTLTFPRGNLAPEGSVVKSAAIDPSVVDADGVYRKEGPARIFVNEKDAMAAIKQNRIQAGDIMVLVGIGPMGTGMEETYQVTSALKHLPFGKHVALITDARFSGVSTGACIGHVGPEGLAGGPIGKLCEGDVIRIEIDRNNMQGSVNLVGEGLKRFTPEEGAIVLSKRSSRKDLAANPALPDDTRLWAALQMAGGGTWAGCVYDVERIVETLQAGQRALGKHTGNEVNKF